MATGSPVFPHSPTSPGPIPNVLTIAGTDPSGGAGIQADLKTFSALGGYGMSVVTALVAQTTTGVSAVRVVEPDFVTAQLDTLFGDVRVDAVKIGMVANAGIVHAVAKALDRHRPAAVVLDPVMVAKSGDALLDPDAAAAVRDELLPRADLITPNLPEAAALLGADEAADEAAMPEQAQRLLDLGPRLVLLKGGHLTGPTSTDLLVGEGLPEPLALTAPRVPTRNTHGTGCTLSSAIAALRPRRPDWPAAVTDAKDYLTGALRHADDLDVGHGHGPVHHFFAMWA
ncbi:bifunctional hydroxymethylpyrimidine kinase/phosphomethylpyrimidine kinase [Allonocardiopsis opalescens]|uniref:Hydroxymethylpyrimidine kinase /phosphomethylpyrimidine kinase n=1 Tax=Allonocardiopsis opalescens TaxID=1144618 RepID=A0A2T0PV83_9ACTN|nr:bifunctional hydroxymethylpyrimidine kinase/phosphomethylpyrimidine kinase [Allonocardiopsis opalescens]PRX95442.1 hydroxymethylpyrimidine kinase /phosphomethylpyrimidine kinase [Allonocardiopsis opalescens]